MRLTKKELNEMIDRIVDIKVEARIKALIEEGAFDSLITLSESQRNSHPSNIIQLPPQPHSPFEVAPPIGKPVKQTVQANDLLNHSVKSMVRELSKNGNGSIFESVLMDTATTSLQQTLAAESGKATDEQAAQDQESLKKFGGGMDKWRSLAFSRK